MIREVKLNTKNMYEGMDPENNDYQLWKKISEYMDGEAAFVIESPENDGKYVFLGLKDKKKNKNLIYMMEQDSMIGTYIDDREGFDKAWEDGEYTPEGFIHLETEYLIFEQEREEG